jgi:hypothetical protein
MKAEQDNKEKYQDNIFKVNVRQICHQLMGFSFAGVEVSNTFLISCFYYLAAYPEV